MTPRRYFAFGCLTVLIQGGVLASQNTKPDIQLAAGSAMGSNQAVSVMVAMQASAQAQSTEQTIKEVLPEVKLEPKPEVKPEPKPEVKPEPKPEVKPEPKPIPEKVVKTDPKKPAPDNVIAKVEDVIEQDIVELIPTPVTEQPQTEKSDTELASTDASATHEQQQVEAQQGITQQTIALQKPTFSAPPSQPNYPRKARKRGFEGTATVEVMFNQMGEQLSLTLVNSSGYSLLDAAAIDAVEKWQFAAPSPQTAFAYTVRVPVKFALN
ncbi:energy transducer TonB [Shewanella intestini]|uniref:Protein TonB n=1 Tax=Shewanella intestini TaxID=2017544 RepID=A0ABS5I2Y3_9GAMM|nr:MULTISPECIES: energy transducer TonB [Shewanella]MBR9728364.1 energy transducer TonB [Shewanella intestini]MRG36706.1 TonB family protein [Shewanella sp. XMDDZSB0408]